MDINCLVVVGASLAGLRAVESARKAGFTGSVTLVGAEPHHPYDRPPLSKQYLTDDPQPIPAFRDRAALDELGVELVLGAPADGLDPQARLVSVAGREIPYDALVLATGASARDLPGSTALAGIHTLRTIDDAIAIRHALETGKRVVVIGAGFIGSEVAVSARKRGLDVTIVEALPTPLERAIGPVMGPACSLLHATHGTDLRCGVTATAFQGSSHVERVVLSDGATLEADLVVVGVGAIPNTGWLEGSGIEIQDGVVADSTLAANVPGIYAAGDVVRWHNPTFEVPMRLEHWTSAGEQGALAARNALDPESAKPYSTVPYFWSDWYDSKIQFAGVTDGAEVTVIDGDVESHRFVALYRREDRLVGALTLNRPAEIMKYRGLIARGGTWREAIDLAETRRATAAANAQQ